MRFCSLGSGSAGNATLIEARAGSGRPTRLLVDCGFSIKELTMRLGRAGLASDEVDAIFVTHEHGDHVGCAVALARKHRIPLWMSRGTWRAIGRPGIDPDQLHFASDGLPFEVGALQLSPYTVAHDALEPLQLRCSDGARHLGLLTDAGSITPHMIRNLQRCDALLLECNHDRDLLAASSYPPSLKSRIGGRLGHLANEAAAELLAACLHAGLRHLVAAHLSERNNSPDLARRALATVCPGVEDDLVVADPALGFGWLDLA